MIYIYNVTTFKFSWEYGCCFVFKESAADSWISIFVVFCLPADNMNIFQLVICSFSSLFKRRFKRKLVIFLSFTFFQMFSLRVLYNLKISLEVFKLFFVVWAH